MLGRILLSIDGVLLLGGAIIADMNDTHMYNPKWTPHAKFHNAQTISLSVILGLATLYYTWRKTSSPAMTKDSLRVACLLGSIYWVAGFMSLLFPGTEGLDPEFGGPGFPQKYPFAVSLCLGIAGTFLEGGF